MVKDMDDLHKLGILVRDVTVSNYLGGKLIDFSRAWTVPHPVIRAHFRMVSAKSKVARFRRPTGLHLESWGIP